MSAYASSSPGPTASGASPSPDRRWPAATSATTSSRPSTFVDGSLLTGDIGRVTDGVVEVLGRLDDVVQVGGVNVAVQAVEDLLATVSADACVLAAPDETWGARLTAYVVPSAETPDDDALAALVADGSAAPAVPRTWAGSTRSPTCPTASPTARRCAAKPPTTPGEPARGLPGDLTDSRLVATIGQWVQGARPRTLPAAIAPVLVGTAVAFTYLERLISSHATACR